MKKKAIIIGVSALLIYLLMSSKTYSKPTETGIIRGCDPDGLGCGHFGASRTGHIHEGEDFKLKPGESVKSIFAGKVVRLANPYASDANYKGVLIENDIYEMKIFYMILTVPVGSVVKSGQIIGTAQNISAKYSPKMTNHVHIQIKDKRTGKFIKPSTLFLK